jgi:hypothetical protein
VSSGCSLLISAESLSTLCRTAARAADVAFNRSTEALAGAAGGATQARRGDQLAIAFLAASPEDCQATPAAKPMTRIRRTRAKANETSIPSHERAFAIMFRTALRRDALFDGSVAGRLLENSDTVEVALEFIGMPPSVVSPGDSSRSGIDSQSLRATARPRGGRAAVRHIAASSE